MSKKKWILAAVIVTGGGVLIHHNWNEVADTLERWSKGHI
jgi:hypothetical protein